jgi:drug/metabolite transporter (DMT)-like permease
VTTAPDLAEPPTTTRPVGLIAICGAILCFSVSSTLVKKSGAPGPTVAFWRMVGSSVVWTAILWFTERRFTTWREIRRAVVPGIAFGLNITLFFTAITHTTVANAEFIGTLTPVVLVPAGAILFKEQINRRALGFGVVSIAGLGLVLFFAPTQSGNRASWFGNILALVAMSTWSTYLLSSRGMRASSSVAGIMAAAMPVATITVLPIVVVSGEINDLSGRAALFVLLLVALTGVVAHGLIVFAQRSVPVGTISLLQVGQPALAVAWSVVLLGAAIRSIQVVGMALVILGLVLMIHQRQRDLPPPAGPS